MPGKYRPSLVQRLLWFGLLWVAGVGAVALVAALIRWALL
jgi:hypothetical protein